MPVSDDKLAYLLQDLKENKQIAAVNLGGKGLGVDGIQSVAASLQQNTVASTLNVKENGLGAEGIRVLAGLLKTNGALTSLNVGGNDFGDQGAAILANALNKNSSLRVLDVELNGIGADGCRALADAVRQSNLTALHLRRNKVGADGALALAAVVRESGTFSSVDLEWNKIGDEGAKGLAKALGQNQTVRSANLSGNNIGDDGARAIADALSTNKSISVVDLEWNNIGAKGATAFANAIAKNATVSSINFSGNNIGEDGANAISKALKENTQVSTVYLGRNKIGDEGVKAIADCLRVNSKLTTLDLEWNSIGAKGAWSVADALKSNGTLTSLNLTGNKMGSHGAQALSSALKVNTTIRSVNLGGNSIGNEGAQVLAEALKMSTQTSSEGLTINLEWNDIGDEGAKAIAEALRVNTTIRSLKLGGNTIADSIISTINNALESNRRFHSSPGQGTSTPLRTPYKRGPATPLVSPVGNVTVNNGVTNNGVDISLAAGRRDLQTPSRVNPTPRRDYGGEESAANDDNNLTGYLNSLAADRAVLENVSKTLGEMATVRNDIVTCETATTLAQTLGSEAVHTQSYETNLEELTRENLELSVCKQLEKTLQEKQGVIRQKAGGQSSLEGLEAAVAERNTLRMELLVHSRQQLHILERMADLYTARESYLPLAQQNLGSALENTDDFGATEDDLPKAGCTPRAAKNTVDEYKKWKREVVSTVGSCMRRTNRLMADLQQALEEEIRACKEHQSLLSAGPEITRRLVGVSRNRLSTLEEEKPEEEMDNLRGLRCYYQGIVRDQERIRNGWKEVETLKKEKVDLDQQKRAKYMRRLDLKKELEIMVYDGAPAEKVNLLKQEIADLDNEIGEASFRLDQITSQMRKLASDYPELYMDPNAKVKAIIQTGLMDEDRKLEHYTEREMLGGTFHRLYRVKYNGQQCCLKEIPVKEPDSLKLFKNEVAVLENLQKKASHPNIVTVDCVFVDGSMAYIQMPYYAGGTLRDWLVTKPTKATIRDVFHQVVDGLSFIHERGVLHRDLKLDNVLMHNGRPVIVDFGISKNLVGAFTTTMDLGAKKGTLAYLAPEVLKGDSRHSQASDMWALGVMIYEAYFGLLTEPLTQPISIPPNQEGEEFREVITSLLQDNATYRLTAREVLVHPYFTLEIVKSDSPNYQLQQCRAAFNSLRKVGRRESGHLRLGISRNHLLDTVLDLFLNMSAEDFRCPLNVRYVNEALISDTGILSSDLYSQFFTELFEREKKGLRFFEAASENGPYLPAADPHFDAQVFRAIGRVLVKCIFDGCPIPIPLAPSLFKFLLGMEDDINFSDFEAYDPERALTFRRLKASPHVESLGINMEDAGTMVVTDANKQQFVSSKIKQILLERRRPQLEAIREGFLVHEVTAHFSNLSYSDLMVLASGEQHIDAEGVIAKLKFVDFDIGSATPQHLKAYISELSTDDLRRFLVLVVGLKWIPFSCLDEITVQRDARSNADFPQAYTCYNRLDLPAYEDYEALRSKMTGALSQKRMDAHL